MTLIEMVMSLIVSSILMVALGSSIIIASRAIPSTSGPFDATASSAEAVDRMLSELMYAKSVTELTSTAVTFTVAPRGTDTTDETIRYFWDRVAGDSLTRQYNGGPAAVVCPALRGLNLTHVTTSKVVGLANLESDEQVLVGYTVTPSQPMAQRINSTSLAAEYFQPTLPTGTVSWKITRVQYQAQAQGSAVGQTNIQLRTASGTTPTNTVIDSGTLSESTLPASFAWQQTSYNSAGGLLPTAGVCLVFQWVSDTDSCAVQYEGTSNLGPAGSTFLQSTDGGNSWAASAMTLRFNVYGTYTSPTNVVQYNLQSVRATLTAGGPAAPSVTSSAEVLNHPQVTGP